jgi:hypothetical protein
MFGTERSGLTNEQLAMADSLIAIPTFKVILNSRLFFLMKKIFFNIFLNQYNDIYFSMYFIIAPTTYPISTFHP